MVKRMLLFLGLVAALFFGLSTQAYAEEAVQNPMPISVTPFWSHTVSISASLGINNGRAVMTGSVIGRVGTERISVNARLHRVNANGTLTHIASWNNLQAGGDIWVWERVHHVARGHNYRLTLTATVFRNGTSETITASRTTHAN